MSVIVVVLPKLEDAKKIRKILSSHGFSRVTACQTGSAVLQETAENERGLVISGYKLPDMYYRELAECLPPHFELLLMGSAAAVSGAESGILSITTPVKVFDLVNTVEMVMSQIERRAKKRKEAPEKAFLAGGKLHPQRQGASDGEKPPDRGGGPPLYPEMQYGQRYQHGGNGADDSDADVR